MVVLSNLGKGNANVNEKLQRRTGGGVKYLFLLDISEKGKLSNEIKVKIINH